MPASSMFVWLSIHSVPHETLLGSNNLFKILHDRLKIKKRKEFNLPCNNWGTPAVSPVKRLGN